MSERRRDGRYLSIPPSSRVHRYQNRKTTGQGEPHQAHLGDHDKAVRYGVSKDDGDASLREVMGRDLQPSKDAGGRLLL